MTTRNFKFNFDEEVQDVITKQKGLIVAIDFWRNGCVRYCVQAPVDKDGKVPDGVWVDEGQLKLFEKPREVPVQNRTGGPRPSTDPGMGR